MINKGIYVDFHEWLHNPARQPQSEKYPGTVPPGCCRDHPDRKNFSGGKCPRVRNDARPAFQRAVSI